MVVVLKFAPLLAGVGNWWKSQKISCCDMGNIVLKNIMKKDFFFFWEMLYLIAKVWIQ